MSRSIRNAYWCLVFPLILAACAQPVPFGGQRGQFGQSTTVEFRACRVVTTFSGSPEKPSADEVQKMLSKELGTYFKWDAEVWRYSQFRLAEVGMCTCRDAAITSEEFESYVPKDESIRRKSHIEGVGTSVDWEFDKSGQERVTIRQFQIASDPKCMMMLLAVTPPGSQTAASPFISSLKPAAIGAGSLPPQPSTGSIPERLRQLDQLLKERLITQDEYNVRRRKILESL